MSHHIVNCAISISTHPLFKNTQSKIGIPSHLMLKHTLKVYSIIVEKELGVEANQIPIDYLNNHIFNIITAYQQNLFDDSQTYFNELVTYLNAKFPVNFQRLSQQSPAKSQINLHQLKSHELLVVHEDEPEYVIEQSLLNLIAWFPLTLAGTLYFEVVGIDSKVPIIKLLLIDWLKNHNRLQLYNIQNLELFCKPINPLASTLALIRNH